MFWSKRGTVPLPSLVNLFGLIEEPPSVGNVWSKRGTVPVPSLVNLFVLIEEPPSVGNVLVKKRYYYRVPLSKFCSLIDVSLVC